jgi:uncharacterized membrane protein
MSHRTAPDQLGLERLVFFSDAVFAIAITLLALEIRLPASAAELSSAQLLAELLGMWHKVLAYMISFLVIGSFWLAHHRKFRFIRRYDSGLLMFNLLLLMVIAFLPFPSAVIAEHGDRVGTIFYALVVLLEALLWTGLWGYAARHKQLIDPHLNARQRRRLIAGPLMTVAVFAASIGLAFIDADLAKLSWLLVVPVALYARS